MPVLYGIVPVADGHHFLGLDNQLLRKDQPNTRNQMRWYIDEQYANIFIKENLDSTQYEAEAFWTRYFICPNCGERLNSIRVTRNGAIWFDCPNEDCGMAWEFQVDDNEKITSIIALDWGK